MVQLEVCPADSDRDSESPCPAVISSPGPVGLVRPVTGRAAGPPGPGVAPAGRCHDFHSCFVQVCRSQAVDPTNVTTTSTSLMMTPSGNVTVHDEPFTPHRDHDSAAGPRCSPWQLENFSHSDRAHRDLCSPCQTHWQDSHRSWRLEGTAMTRTRREARARAWGTASLAHCATTSDSVRIKRHGHTHGELGHASEATP